MVSQSDLYTEISQTGSPYTRYHTALLEDFLEVSQTERRRGEKRRGE
jgi:hypothetical protein